MADRITNGDDNGGGYAVEATFDGGAREVRGVRAGGAGATMWRLDDNTGMRVRSAAATMALPHVTDSQEAEAWGAHLAMRLLLETEQRQTDASQRR